MLNNCITCLSDLCSSLLDWQEQFELRWKLLLTVQSVTEIDAANATICMNLDSQGLNVVCTWHRTADNRAKFEKRAKTQQATSRLEIGYSAVHMALLWNH